MRLTVGFAFASLTLPVPDIKLCTATCDRSHAGPASEKGRFREEKKIHSNGRKHGRPDFNKERAELARRIKPKSVELGEGEPRLGGQRIDHLHNNAGCTVTLYGLITSLKDETSARLP